MGLNIAKGKIGNALTSTSDNHVVAVAADLYDEVLEMYQSEINALVMKISGRTAGEDVHIYLTSEEYETLVASGKVETEEYGEIEYSDLTPYYVYETSGSSSGSVISASTAEVSGDTVIIDNAIVSGDTIDLTNYAIVSGDTIEFIAVKTSSDEEASGEVIDDAVVLSSTEVDYDEENKLLTINASNLSVEGDTLIIG